ncbi:MAG: CoB--CoM heterodisulfide reductase iron-sulfur subunit B family protein [Anaerolineae bacterium]
MKIPYFPGCTLSTKAKGFDLAGRAAAQALGYELVELPQWNCCGAAFPLAVDNLMAFIAPTRVLINAQEGENLATLCAICYHVLKRTNHFLRQEAEKRERINLFIEEAYDGEVRVVHFLELLRDELGFEALSERVVKKLDGLKVAPYYGCLLLRPYEEIGLDDPEAPTILDDFLASLGCEVVDFPYKTECCGAYLLTRSAEVTTEMSYSILSSAARQGAEALVTSCPLCQFNLEYRQDEMARQHTDFVSIPVLYFTQLLAMALGLEPATFGLEGHQVDLRPLLKNRELV